MTEQQIPKLVGALVEHQNAFAELPLEDAQWAIQNTVAAISLCVAAIKNRHCSELLEDVGTVTIARTERFIARKKFAVDTTVKISCLGDNFQELFLGKVEELLGEITLRYQKLRKASRDISIINELGGEEKAETVLAEIYALLERQRNGEKGTLLTNGYANIFYVRNVIGVLCAVDVRWRGDGWFVGADSVGSPYGWYEGHQVFSRK